MMAAIRELFAIGGLTMYGIAICSVAALAIFLERIWSLRPSKVIPADFFIDIEELVRGGKIAEALILCRKNGSTFARLLLQGLSHLPFGAEETKEVIAEESARQAYDLERGIGVLAMIMTLAPLLGFLGTVLGMVELFSNIAAQGEVQNIGIIAGGVYKALYTTIAGLAVAIPATLFHKYCLATVDRRLIRIQEMAMQIVARVKESTSLVR